MDKIQVEFKVDKGMRVMTIALLIKDGIYPSSYNLRKYLKEYCRLYGEDIERWWGWKTISKQEWEKAHSTLKRIDRQDKIKKLLK